MDDLRFDNAKAESMKKKKNKKDKAAGCEGDGTTTKSEAEDAQKNLHAEDYG